MIEVVKNYINGIMSKGGINVNGRRPFDIQIRNEDFYSKVGSKGRLGLGESYMDGDWTTDSLDQFVHRILTFNDRNVLTEHHYNFLTNIKDRAVDAQSKLKSLVVANEHYNLGNEFYSDMLDPRMQYTCAYFDNTNDLNEAQEKKLDLICKKLKLKEGEKVLELGGGWGGFANFAAENYGVNVTSYNISKEQIKYAREKNNGLPIEIIESDYRDATGDFDKVASVGLCEHVGYKHYRELMKTANNALKPRGLFLLHTITGNEKSLAARDKFIEKYIFPGGMLPSPAQLLSASEGFFVEEDSHNFGQYYDKTLMAWHENFIKNWDKHKDSFKMDKPGFEKWDHDPEKFKRMWEYYLLGCAGAFRARAINLHQFVFSKGGVPGGYEAVR